MEDKILPEQQYRNKIDPFLEEHFYIEREVWSSCMKSRIDYILKCKQSGIILGLEVKSIERKRGCEVGKIIMQCDNYTKLKWKTSFAKEPIKVLIFLAPSMSKYIKFIDRNESKIIGVGYNAVEYFKPFHKENHSHDNFASLISEVFNFGDVISIKNYGTFFRFKNKNIWGNRLSEKGHLKNYNFYNDKL